MAETSNYKGILLSSRPASDLYNREPLDQANEVRSLIKAPFLPSGLPSDFLQTGLPPSKEEELMNYTARLTLKANLTSMKKKNVVGKHKQWLRKYSDELNEKRVEKVESEQKDGERMKNFFESQKELRRILREESQKKGQLGSMKFQNASLSKVVHSLEVPSMQSPSNEVHEKKNKIQRPLWAISERKFLEEDNDDELKDLLDFANSLDYEQYISDLEVKEALSIIQSRVNKLKREKNPISQEGKSGQQEMGNGEQQTEQLRNRTQEGEASTSRPDKLVVQEEWVPCENRKMKTKQAQHDECWNSSTRVEEDRVSVVSEHAKRGSQFLKGGQAIHSKHSKASLGQMIELVNKMNNVSDLEAMEQMIKSQQKDIHMVIHDGKHQLDPLFKRTVQEICSAEENSQENRKRHAVQLKNDLDNVQNLPYMYRCPSI